MLWESWWWALGNKMIWKFEKAEVNGLPRKHLNEALLYATHISKAEPFFNELQSKSMQIFNNMPCTAWWIQVSFYLKEKGLLVAAEVFQFLWRRSFAYQTFNSFEGTAYFTHTVLRSTTVHVKKVVADVCPGLLLISAGIYWFKDTLGVTRCRMYLFALAFQWITNINTPQLVWEIQCNCTM